MSGDELEVEAEVAEPEAWPLPPHRRLRPMNCEKIVSELKDVLVQIEGARLRIDELAPEFSAEALEIQPQMDAFQIYHSNAIEGNSLTTEETEEVVLRGATIAAKPLKDSLEARNLAGALRTARKLAQESVPFDEQALLTLHDMVLRGVDNDAAGRLRQVQVQISGNPIQPPDALDVPDCLQEFWWWLSYGSSDLQPVVRAAVAHWWFVRIHPFRDGNGRVGRLLFYFLLARAGFRLEPVILKEERLAYYEALARADAGDLRPICEFICKAVTRSLRSFEEKLVARQQARTALLPSLDKIKQELGRQQAEKHEAWAIAMKEAEQQFRYAAKEVQGLLEENLQIRVEDFGVLSFEKWKNLLAVGRLEDPWLFMVTVQLPVRRFQYVFWFTPHPTFVQDALGVGPGIGLSVSKREGDQWVKLAGPRKPSLRHLFLREGRFFAQFWLDRGSPTTLRPIREVELRSVALDFVREALESDISIRA